MKIQQKLEIMLKLETREELAKQLNFKGMNFSVHKEDFAKIK